MRLAYIDESYNASTYWFGAVLVPESADAAMQRTMLAAPSRYAAYGVPDDAELHGYDLWNATGDWSGLSKEPRLREHAMRVALRAAVDAQASLLFVGVDRRDDPKLDTLTEARAATVAQLLAGLEAHSLTSGERCLLIFDEETSTTKELISAVHSHHRTELVAGRDPRIVEAPICTPSRSAPGVQVADIAVYLHRRAHAGPENDPRAQETRDRLLGVIAPAISMVFGP